MSKVHVYLDVDGVLNAVSRSTQPNWGWPTALVTKVNGFQICYSPEMVDALNDLSEHATFHWLTTWRDDAPRLLAPAIGVKGEAWPVIDGPEFGHSWWWKHNAIRAHIEQTQPDLAFWIDDDLRFDHKANIWLHQNPHVVPICPVSEVGLTLSAVEQMTEAVTAARESA